MPRASSTPGTRTCSAIPRPPTTGRTVAGSSTSAPCQSSAEPSSTEPSSTEPSSAGPAGSAHDETVVDDEILSRDRAGGGGGEEAHGGRVILRGGHAPQGGGLHDLIQDVLGSRRCGVRGPQQTAGDHVHSHPCWTEVLGERPGQRQQGGLGSGV